MSFAENIIWGYIVDSRDDNWPRPVKIWRVQKTVDPFWNCCLPIYLLGSTGTWTGVRLPGWCIIFAVLDSFPKGVVYPLSFRYSKTLKARNLHKKIWNETSCNSPKRLHFDSILQCEDRYELLATDPNLWSVLVPVIWPSLWYWLDSE